MEPSPAELADGPLTADEIALLDRLADRWILGGDRVRVKLWALGGVVLYPDVHDLIARSFADVRPRLALAVEVTWRGREYRRLVELSVPVRDRDGRAVAVIETYASSSGSSWKPTRTSGATSWASCTTPWQAS